MNRFLSLIRTNLRVIFRSRVTTLLVLLAPILIVFLIGTAFSSSSLRGIDVGVYSEEYNNLTDSILDGLEQKRFYSEKIDSEQECINSIKSGATEICIVFPPNLSIKGDEKTIKIHADDSRTDLVYNLIHEINSQISEKGSELGITITDDILNILLETKDSLSSEKIKLQSTINSLDDISSKKDDVSAKISLLNTEINNLEEIINDLDSQNVSSSTKENLGSLKTELTNIKTEMSEDTESIESVSGETESSIIQINLKIEKLIEEISNTEKYTAEDIVDPIKSEVEFINKESTNWEKLFPTFLSLIILLSSIILASTMVLKERKSRAYFRNFTTPTSDLTFVFGMYSTSMIIIILQLFILLLGCAILTNLSLGHIAGELALISFLSASVFVLVGMSVGYLFKSDETIILASISIASLFIFFSNIILPTETIVEGFKNVVSYNPLFVLENMFKRVILFNSEITTMLKDFITLIIAGLVFFVLSLIFRKITRRKI